MKLHSLTTIVVLLAFAPAALSAGSIAAPEGYTSVDTVITVPLGAWFGGFDVLPNGNFVIADGSTIREITPAGIEIRTLYTYPSSVYSSFVRYNSATDSVYFAESSTNTIMSAPVSGGSAAVVTTLPLAYDMDFWAGTPYVAAGNTVFVIDESTGAAEAVAQAGLVSGPLAFDSDGSLIYGTGNPNWPPTTDDQNIYKWSAAQLAGVPASGLLGPDDAVLLAADVNAPGGFAFTAEGELVYTDSQVAPAVLRLVRNGSADLYAPIDIPGELPWATVIRSNPAVGGISVAVSWLDSGWQSHTVISTLMPVPEPSALAGTASLIALAIPALRMRRRTTR